MNENEKVEEGLKVQLVMDLIEKGYSRPQIAGLMGYSDVQSVHNLAYQGKERQKNIQARLADPMRDPIRRNVVRVREYIEKFPNALKKQIQYDLSLAQHTVNRALRIIEAEDLASGKIQPKQPQAPLPNIVIEPKPRHYWLITEPDGVQVTADNLNQYCRERGLDSSTIKSRFGHRRYFAEKRISNEPEIEDIE